MGYHSGLNGEYSSNIPVKVNNRHTARFKRCCKEEVPEEAIKVETYLKDDTIYFVLPSNYKPVKICFDNAEELRPSAPPEGVVYGGKGNQKLNVDFHSSDPYSSGYYYKDNSVNISNSINYATKTSLSPSAPETDDYVNISDMTDYAQPNNTYENSNTYVSIFDSLLDLNKQLNGMGCSAEDAGDALSNIFDKLYNK